MNDFFVMFGELNFFVLYIWITQANISSNYELGFNIQAVLVCLYARAYNLMRVIKKEQEVSHVQLTKKIKRLVVNYCSEKG